MQKLFLFITFIICVCKTVHAQNVGIGTTTPTEKLHVAGNIKADTLKPNGLKIVANAGAGKLLTSDATGNASWQDRTGSTNANGTVGFGSWGDCSMNGISEYNPVADTAAAAGEGFGFSLCISGNFAIVGVPFGGNNPRRGYADMYQYNGSNWVLMQKLTDPTNNQINAFGYSVAISGNFAIVGAIADSVGENPGQGSACIFQYNGNSWVFMQKITDPSGTTLDLFGNTVSISGNNAIVGIAEDDVGLHTDQGSAIVFHYNGTSWVFVQKLTDPTGAANDQFGISVAISGNFAIVGAPTDQVGANDAQGSASIYQLNGSNWIFLKKITDSSSEAFAEEGFGTSVSISGNSFVVGAGGSATAYVYDGTQWVFKQRFTGTASTNFGNNVSISGNYLLIGNSLSGSNSTGSALLYTRMGLQWQRLQNITDPAGETNDQFGSVVSVDGTVKRFLIGVKTYANQSGKAVFGKF